MKKNFSLICAAAAVFAIFFSCAKEEAGNTVGDGNSQDESMADMVTVSATLTDAMTKVAFAPSYDADGKPIEMALTWESGDRLRVYNHDDRTKYDDLSLISGEGQKKGVFAGIPVNVKGATKYDVEVVSEDGFSYSTQTQPADGVSTDLKYLASASGLADYSNVEFTDFSSVLAITAKLPEGVAAKIKSVELKASENIFDGAKKLTVTLAEVGDAHADGILHVFATLPQGTVEIPEGTTLVAHFNAPGETHDIYTRFVEFGTNVSFLENRLNTINLNAVNSAAYANASTENIGSESNPYLVGDKWQFDAMRGEIGTELKYFEMIDDIDMTGIAWNPMNTVQANCLHFEGNNYTLSNVTSAKSQSWQSIFGCLTGTVQNLKVDRATMVAGNAYSGVLASHLGASGSTMKTIVTNVTITNSTLGTAEQKGSAKFGILSGGTESSKGVEISGVTIADCSVASTSYVGGLIGQTSAVVKISGENKIIRTYVCGSIAGGAIGYASKLLTMSGCTYSGGTVATTDMSLGGMIGSTANVASVISDCHVVDAVIDATQSSSTSDLRCGGFIGVCSQNVTVKGCSVGTESKRVIVKLGNSAEGSAVNSGGFAGYAYGTFTKNGDVRNKAYVTITCTNTDPAKRLNIGGFAGYHQNKTVEYSDVDVLIENMAGTFIGGFAGAAQGGTISNCTATGTVTSNGGSTIGGFIGGTSFVSADCRITGNSASVNVSGVDYVGGFVGSAVGTYTSNHSTGTVTATATSGHAGIGGFAGRILENSSTAFSRNYSTGDVKLINNTNNAGGLIGYIGGNLTMSDCYATGNVGASGAAANKTGGLVGYSLTTEEGVTEGITISNCYAAGNVYGRSVTGGLYGRMNSSTVTLEGCVAWTPVVNSVLNEAGRYSSGAVVGTAYPNCTIKDCYRRPGLSLAAYWVPENLDTFQHPDVSAEHPLVNSAGEEMTDDSTVTGQPNFPQYAYHGKINTTATTLSVLARDVLGWSSDIWDFSKDLPTLK